MPYQLPSTLTTANAADCALRLNAAVRNGETQIDASQLGHCDSSAVAVLLAARRLSKVPLVLQQPPLALLTLASLYGAAELLDLPFTAPAARHAR